MSDIIYKKCSTCRQTHPITSFHKQPGRKDGHSYHCKHCTSERSAKRYLNNIQHYRTKNYEYFDTHREQRRIYATNLRQNHPEKVKQYTKTWQEKNPGYQANLYQRNKTSVGKQRAKYRKDNPNRWNLISKRWRDANPGKVRADNIKRLAQKRQAIPPWFEYHEVRQLYINCARITQETGIQHHVDHIVPLRGEMVCGLHCLANLRIISRCENLAKGNKLVEELI